MMAIFCKECNRMMPSEAIVQDPETEDSLLCLNCISHKNRDKTLKAQELERQSLNKSLNKSQEKRRNLLGWAGLTLLIALTIAGILLL